MAETKKDKKDVRSTEEIDKINIEEKSIKEIKEPNTDKKVTESDTKNSKKIYIGPNLLQLTTYTVVEGEFPEHIKDVIEKCTSIEKLFVNVTELAHYEKRTKTKGTLEHRNYMKIIEFAQGKGE